MSALGRLERTRAMLAVGVGVGAVLWGAAVALSALALFAAVDWLHPLSHGARIVLMPMAATCGLAAAGVVLWRGRHARSAHHVALWIEERVPALRYALVTLLEQRAAGADSGLERSIAAVQWHGPLRRALIRAVGTPALVVLLGGALLRLLLPTGLIARVGAPRAGDLLDRPASMASRNINLIVPLVATVTPPAYSGGERSVLEEPSTVPGLAGSAIVLEGHGAADSVRATIGDAAVRAQPAGTRWRMTFTMPAHAVALRLTDGRHTRLVALEGRVDSIPAVTLLSPVRDTVLRAPTGSLALRAEARDDIGLARGWFEYIVSSGDGESFAFRSGVLGRTALRGRTSSLRAMLALDSLKLVAGDIVHIRAVANDGNTLTGPGAGASETRTVRIARVGEYDSLAVESAPPAEADRSAISQRMLITLAEALQRQRPRLTRPVVVEESRSIAGDQTRLRKRVADVIFLRLEGDPRGEEARGEGAAERGKLTPDELLARAQAASDTASRELLDFEGGESPVVAINRPLLEAYNAMWGASRELESGEPARALPHMRLALAAIQRARAAERIYLRGRPATAVVDVDKVRLAGPIAGARPSSRSAYAPLDPASAAQRARLDAALALAHALPAAAIDSLLVLRVGAVGSAPTFAGALREAIDALRAGRDATASLARVRRVLAGEPSARDSLPRWGGAW